MTMAAPAATGDAPASASAVRLGLRANMAQFSLLVVVNALVGGTIGQERTVLPLLAEREFGLTAYTAGLMFIVAFGITKALTNLVAGTLADRVGRKPVLVAGWLVGIPVPLLLIWAPAWGWVVAANVLLGVNQGLTWSTTVIMKIDLAGPERRGLAMGLNEAAGYGALAATAAATGWIATNHGLRPEPFLLGAAYIAIGLGLSALFVRETRGHAQHEAANHPPPDPTLPASAASATPTLSRRGASAPSLTLRQVLAQSAWRDRSLLAINQAGLVNNLNDGLAWGLLPILFSRRGDLGVTEIGLLAAIYPAVWATGQLVTGALSDRTGRKALIVTGMLIQAVALAGFAAATGTAAWVVAAVGLGVGTAFVYPTLLAAIGDVAHPTWRASAVGVYRLWRDSGYAIGALVAGITADLVGLRGAILTVAALTAASGLIAARLLTETHTTTGDSTMSNSKVHHPVFARFYAWLSPRMERAGFSERRDSLLAGLTGRVIEVGAGNGMNFAHYPPEVTHVLAVEPEPRLRELARHNADKSPIPITVVDGTADQLSAEDASYDAAVASLVLCSVSDVPAALAEMRRALKPGGQLRFLEHVRADTPGLARVQRILDATIWPTVGGGCHSHRDTRLAIETAGFTIDDLEQFRLPETRVPSPTSPHILGVATAPP
jgi:MFS family permease